MEEKQMSENNMMPELTLAPQAAETAPVLTLDAEVADRKSVV